MSFKSNEQTIKLALGVTANPRKERTDDLLLVENIILQKAQYNSKIINHAMKLQNEGHQVPRW